MPVKRKFASDLFEAGWAAKAILSFLWHAATASQLASRVKIVREMWSALIQISPEITVWLEKVRLIGYEPVPDI